MLGVATLTLWAVLLTTPVAADGLDPAVASDPDGVWTVRGATLGPADLTDPEVAVALPVPEGGSVSSLAMVDDGWFVAGSAERRLFVLVGGTDGAAAAVTAPGSPAPVQRNPVLLTDQGELAGLAWLEGDGAQGMAVRAARWHGDHFGAPERVSEVGPGSQVALDGTVLADGAWLLTWAAFDGVDTEIVHAERRADRWLEVAQVSPPNDLPDALPTVAATPDGAVVAWSRMAEGTYGVVMRRLVNGEWAPMVDVGGPDTLFPDFQTVSGRLFLLYQQGGAQRDGGRVWTVLELDDDARPIRSATAAVRTAARPVLAPDLSTLVEPGTERRGWRSRLRWSETTGGAR